MGWNGGSSRQCRKPNCQTGHRSIQRHHKGHEKFILSVYWYKLKDTSIYQSFKERYWKFHKQDVVELCEPHHVEIHILYNRTISKYRKQYGSPAGWSWSTGMELRQDLRRVCNNWLKKDTPGSVTNFNKRPYKKKRKKK